MGWWITPDFRGNGEFIAHAPGGAAHPADIPAGAWRSPLVESDLNRPLHLGFVKDMCAESLSAAGTDAAMQLRPDGHTTYDFSRYVFEPDGLHHGKPTFKARDKTADDDAAGAPREVARAPLNLAVFALICVAVGVVAGAVLARRR